ncbi:uncharacterized protein Z519_02162 [Cladophialophora bantiana CBS 173.52]|uniref:Nucleoside transporter n=1 Tax=Cladophialophora bantiana (strain ATCC 10958 / CBS 173.52 / CDC B-1940 / NIH 8579) TaxID=1442370 RepID=A0A0D2F3D8_CLAB1|nr:uncharacterized protein Z519_02162 [Cladophialophora bantiana CBS 173.52]KIW96771.1 hypothetical protein Z519_02162 [Cladophialophora bantiana CBS 173.52]
MSDNKAFPVPTLEESKEHHISDSPHHHAAPHDYLSVVENGLITDVTIPNNRFQRWALRLETLARMEARGIERVPETLKAEKVTMGDYVQMCLVWFSANLTANNAMIGMLGPIVFGLGLTDAMVLATFGALLGGAASGYIATFGPVSGNRTLVICRYTMGWWPSRLCVALNIVIMLGYGLIDVLIAGQILSAVNGGGMTVIVGVIISSVISLFIVLFGIRLFHQYERWAWVPQAAVFLILVGVAGPYFDPSSVSTGGGSVRSADQMSFFFLCVAGPLAWSPASADFYVYFPTSSKRWKVLIATTIGLGGSCVISNLIGIGLASGIPLRQAWADAVEISSGALFVEAFRPLGNFGHFCSVILALGLISNNVPGTYSAALSFQLLGRWFNYLPRVFWTTIAVVIYTVCACAGRKHLFTIVEGFVVIMGYWTAVWVALTMEEEFIFRRGTRKYDWTDWNDKNKLPIGIAALIAFCVGWVGAVLGMWQTYFTGPLARLVGDGIDLGIPVAASWGALVYPPLRYLELKYIGR